VTDEAALSRRMLARARDGSLDGDEAARALLQKRLEVYSRVIFWAFVALRALEAAMYAAYPQVKPELYSWIFETGIVSLVAMAVCWRGFLMRRALSVRVLGRIDLAYAAGCGLVFGATALLAHDRHESAVTCFCYACFVVFTRALVVPSSGTWTLKVSLIAFAPVVIAAAALAAGDDEGIPGLAYLLCSAIYSAIAVTIATAGSRFIYGLRRRVREHARLGAYTLDRKLGEGRLGPVYRARHALLRRPTALKLLQPDRVGAGAIARFERAVQQMSQLTHPNTVAVFDYGHSDDGVFYYAMEYLDGIDLAALVRTYGPQPAGRAIDILAQVCGALHEAHLRGLVHGDLTPAKIVVCERGGRADVAKVADFGLAHERTAAADGAADLRADLRALGEVARVLLGREDAAIAACLRAPQTAAEVARALRALRVDDGWSAAAAVAWWQAFRADAHEPAASAPQLHVQVDLAARADV
jgi:serine/threonine-protein kinase